jgi:hypothetical protein
MTSDKTFSTGLAAATLALATGCGSSVETTPTGGQATGATGDATPTTFELPADGPVEVVFGM